MIDLLLGNILAYSGQVAILVAVAAVLTGLLRLTSSARLYCLQGVLLCALVLPFAQPWRIARADAHVTFATTVVSEGPAQPSKPEVWIPSIAEFIAIVLALGMCVRLGMLGIGMIRLRRYMDRARLIPNALEAEKQRIGVNPDVFVSAELRGPVTFGLLRPVLLIPNRWLGNETVAYHELIHVRRRDWGFAMVEEFIRAVLWFHPGVWWLISRIQLAREEVVDRQVIQLMQSRERYLDTLLAIAEAKAGLDLAPAQLFLKRRHLRQRVAALLKEVVMSRVRITSSLAGFAAVMACTGWMAIHSFPLQAAPQVKDAPGVTVHIDESKILHRDAVRYPKAAIEKGIQGTVMVDATLDQNGEISDTQVLSGPQELRHAALESIMKWHYEKPSGGSQRVQIAIDFALPPITESARKGFVNTSPAGGKITRVDLGQIPQPLRDRAAAVIGVTVGDELTPESAAELSSRLTALDNHLHLSMIHALNNGGVSLSVVFASELPSQPQRIRVGGNVQAVNLVNKVTPAYPPDAKAARIQGTVRFTATVGKDGHIIGLDLVSGHPMLVDAAREAVQQWVYKPTLLNGNPVEVVTQIDVNFTLSE